MYGSEDSFGPTFVSALTSAVAGYLDATWFKKKPGSFLPMMAEGVAAVGGLGMRSRIRHPYGAAVSEGLGYYGAGALGEDLAANTKTLGGVVASAIPRNRSAHTASPAFQGGGGGRVIDRGNAVVRQPLTPNFGWSPMAEMGYTG